MLYSSHGAGSLAATLLLEKHEVGFVRSSIRNCRVVMTVLRPDDRGTGMSASHFFFLLNIGILRLVDETCGSLSPK
jgi:hypothetical protein